MLNANPADSAKLVDKIVAILDWNGTSVVETDEGLKTTGTPHVYVRTRDFYESCKLSSLPRRYFNDEVNDVLSHTAVCRKIGIWAFTEVGDGFSVFVYLGPHPGTAGVQAVIDAAVKAGNATLVTSFDFDDDPDDDASQQADRSSNKRR